MNPRLLAVLIIFPVWLTLVLVFRKHRQWLLYYLVAAFGLTIQLVLLVEYLGWDQILVNVASFHVSIIGKYLFHIPLELLTNGRFQIIMSDGSSSILKLGIECSAILESSVVVSLIIFYPLFNISQKILRALFALVVTYVINILRLMIIVLMAYKFGPDYIFIAHAGVARIIFFICELILYWYLMTKPSVKAVGQSIEGRIPIGRVASIGHAFKLRYAITQISVIIIFAILVGASFAGSNEWRVALTPTAQKERPIIYQDETAMETRAPSEEGQVLGASTEAPITPDQNQVSTTPPATASTETNPPVPIAQPTVAGLTTSSLNQEITLNLAGGEKSLQSFNIQQEESLNVQVLDGHEDLAARLILNGENVELVTMPAWLFNKVTSIFKPLTVKPGDVLELRFQNLTETPSEYLIKIFGDGTENAPASPPEPVISPPTPQPQPTSPPLVQVPAPAPERNAILSQVQKYLAGLVSGLTEEIPTDILVIKETAAVLAQQFESFGHRCLQLTKYQLSLYASKGQQLANLCQENLKNIAENLKISEKALKLLIARQEPPIVYQDETGMETPTSSEEGLVSVESTGTPVTSGKNDDYCDAGFKQTDIISNVETETNQTEVSTTPPATASTETKTLTSVAGKVLGQSTEADQYSDLQKKNLKLQLENIFLLTLSTILGATSLILTAIIIYLLKKKRIKRNVAEIISEGSNEQ